MDAIAGLDYNGNAIIEASKYIPSCGYRHFLKIDGLKGKRLGLFRNEFINFDKGYVYSEAFEVHLSTLRQKVAVLVENVNASKYLSACSTSTDYEALAITAEFKLAINSYLKELVLSPARSLKDLIAFNDKFSEL
ncbi:probable amidase At4g34880 [Hibiscus syriacus]|uniref:probable amidase At4g34880 n=1 Tax=Hibiscus syriacus TaxID=106335 RepID=UPI0019238547|nr:probable amidase At4g34880 [Hibiscus syriacus]